MLDTREAAARLHLSPRTLEGLRVRGEGPPFIKLGARSVRYAKGDLEEWIASRRRRSTSDAGDGRATARP